MIRAVLARLARSDRSGPRFDLEARGSRFTMRPALAIQMMGPKWRERAEERYKDAARLAIGSELGEDWLQPDPDLGKVKALNGSHGRGASGWIPVLEWLGLQAAGGIVGLGAAEGARAGIRRIREKIREARQDDHRPLVSRGLAAFLAMEYVFENTEEREVLHVEVAQEPSVLGGRPPSETSYTGLEPWIVSLVNGPRKTRYVLVVSPEGDIDGCITAAMGEFDYMFGLLPPTD